MIAIAIIGAALSVWQTYISNIVGQRVMHDLRAAVYRHLQRMSLAFFTRTRTGEVQSRIANDIGGLDNVVTQTATTIAQNITTVIASIVAMCLLDWRLAAISLAFVPLFVWLTRRVGKTRRRITSEQQRRLADLSSLVNESLSVSGIMLGKTMGRSGDLADRFTGESADIADLEVRSRMAGRWLMSTIQMTFAIQPAIIYWLAGQSFIGAIPIGTVVAFTTLQTRLLFPIQSLLGVGPEIESSLALFDRIFEYLDLPVDIVESQHPVDLRPDEVLGEFRFEDVSFSYSGDAPWTVEGIDITVPAGTRTAIVGETGAGKTTLGYLAARLYDPQRGRVTIDGVDVREASLSSLAATVGVVSQETYLFHASVRENLRFARPQASDEEIEEAARTARIHDLIVSLPEGYDTIVGERGYRFSGGEKQRMAIARTVLRNPHDRDDRAPPLDRPRRRSDNRARPRTGRRAWHARRADRAGRALRGARRAGRERTAGRALRRRAVRARARIRPLSAREHSGDRATLCVWLRACDPATAIDRIAALIVPGESRVRATRSSPVALVSRVRDREGPSAASARPGGSS